MSALPSTRPSPTPRRASGPRLRVVARPRHTARWVAACLVLVVLGVIGVVSLSALAAEAAFEAHGLQAEVAELAVRYDELTADVASLEAPDRIREIAESELGMVRPDRPTFLEDDRSSGAAVGHRDQRLADRVKPVRTE